MQLSLKAFRPLKEGRKGDKEGGSRNILVDCWVLFLSSKLLVGREGVGGPTSICRSRAGWFGDRGLVEGGGDDVTIFRSNKSPEQGPNLSRS